MKTGRPVVLIIGKARGGYPRLCEAIRSFRNAGYEKTQRTQRMHREGRRYLLFDMLCIYRKRELQQRGQRLFLRFIKPV
jgi:hypothetical protein